MTTSTTEHPDVELLRKLVRETDEASDGYTEPVDTESADACLGEATDGVVDPHSLFVVAVERSGDWLGNLSLTEILQNLPQVMAAAFMDAFLLGARFAQERAK